LKEKPKEAGCGTRLQYQGIYTNPTYGKKTLKSSRLETVNGKRAGVQENH
jgi:hypothetical protein